MISKRTSYVRDITASSPFHALKALFGANTELGMTPSVRAYNIECARVDIIASGDATLKIAAPSLPVRSFLIAHDHERGTFHVPSVHRKSGTFMTRGYATAALALAEVARAQAGGESVQLTAKQARVWVASLRGVHPETTTREYLRIGAHGVGLLRSLPDSHNKPRTTRTFALVAKSVDNVRPQ